MKASWILFTASCLTAVSIFAQVTLRALQLRPDDTAGFGELTFKAQVTVEYLVESR
jgi:hypothetical protein